MFASITCLGMATRTRRVHVPAFADSYLPGVTVSLKAAQSTYKGPGADAPERAAHRERVCRACGHARGCKSPVQGCVEPKDTGSARASPRGGV
jgi:hypothetical protein